MKALKTNLILLLIAGGGLTGALGQFSSGSDGSYGPIDITAHTTLVVPADGIFHATTINIAAGTSLRFNRNAHNTPVYLLATGDVTISGDIVVSGNTANNVAGGLGGPGGFDGGNPASVSTPPGDGFGPGAGRAGAGGVGNVAQAAGPGGYATTSGTTSTNKGAAYGSALLIPMVGGSGGGGTEGTPGFGGGGGGGAILIASSTRIHLTSSSADIFAQGGGSQNSTYVNGGSGGAIRLVAPVISGNGNLRVDGSHFGAPGRIRVDTMDRTGLGLNYLPSGITSIGSLMVVFPTPVPRLDIIEAAGTTIPEGSDPVVFILPFGSSPDRTVRVQAQDFNDIVPITVVLTPDNGPSVQYEAEIDNQTTNPAEVTVNVTLPVNVQTTIHAWTR
ncbi:MAG TPA: hypothetical protein VMS21_11385 [Methylomirabilota bacterium]|nr:hypothetical protein [Methylomirabilota bacterium]